MLVGRPAEALSLTSGVPKVFDTLSVDPRLLGYGLYASQSLKLNDGVQIRPWRMGTGGNLYMGVGTVVHANTFVVGNAGWGRSSVIQGDLRVGGQFSTQAGAWIHGAVIHDSTLTPMRLRFPQRFIPTIQTLFVESRDSVLVDASTGDYPSDITVRAGGKLVLRGSGFVFHNLVLSPTAKVYFQSSVDSAAVIDVKESAVCIEVHGEFLVDGAIMLGEAHTDGTRKVRPDGRSILWMYSGTQELHLNGTSRFLGTLVAPNAKVSIASSAGFQGSLWAKDVEIHQYNGNLRFLPYMADSRASDRDQDGLDDSLEFRLGTDPYQMDTDGDGYTDGLEVWGRQNRMGAIKGVTQASPHFYHSWGWALDSTRRDLFNPLRRDQFLRLVWQDSNELRMLQTATGKRWVNDSVGCIDSQFLQRQPATWSQFAPAWRDSAYLDRFVAVFADPSDMPLVKNPHTARVPDYTVVMHLDAGPGASRNLESGLPLFGGEVLVATGGTNTGRGPYSYDLNGDGRLSNKDTTLPEKACDGTFLTETDERTPLLERLFRGWTEDPFRDSWVLAIGFLANGIGQPMDQGIASSHLFLPAQVSDLWALRRVLLHEYGHAIGLHHPRSRNAKGLVVKENGTALLADGLMNYGYGGGMFQRCHQVQGATAGDSRWCGPHPQRVPDKPWFRNWVRGDSDRFFNLTWWRNEYDSTKGLSWNDTTSASDTVLSWEGGPLDPRTGFRPTRDRFSLADLHYSRGVYCGLRLDSLVEADGIARCRDAHGDSLPARIAGTPIDWNQNGVIDLLPVNLWGVSGEASVPWWIGFSGKAPVVKFLNSQFQSDENDWLVWMAECKPFIGLIGNKSTFVVGIPDGRQDLKLEVRW